MTDEFFYWDALLNNDQYNIIARELNQGHWKFGAREIDKPELRSFWYMELKGTQVESIFKNKIESFLSKNITTDRLYANGQAHGQSAGIHRDMDPSDGDSWHSLVYYAHLNWKPEYGGHLIFVDDSEKEVTHSFFPKFNSAVMFKCKHKHMALEPTVYCKEQRISIAYKFKIEE